MSHQFNVSSNQALCCNCLKAQSNLNFLCICCKSSRLISYKDLNELNIVHIDCDSFFASVEKSTNPDLAKKPVIISGLDYGIVTTACYQARKFGIYSTMPVQKALRLCPKAKLIAPDMDKYKNFSLKIHKILLEFTPLIEPASIDEYYLDFVGTNNLHKASAYTIMRRAAYQIMQELNITVSIGLSYCKFMAKFASDIKKPFGFSIINKNEAKYLIANYPIARLNGIGKTLENKLNAENIISIKDLQNANPISIKQKYGKIGTQIQLYSLGIDSRPVTSVRKIKSISKEKTFRNFIKNKYDIKNQLYILAQKLSKEMKKDNIAGNNIVLKLTLSNKTKLIRTIQITEHTNFYTEIFEKAYFLLQKENIQLPIYLLGVGLKNLISINNKNYNKSFDIKRERKILLEKATDDICNKFGPNIISLAQLKHKKIKW